MSARRCFNVTLRHLKSSPLTLGKASVTPKTGLYITCLQQQISWQIVWKLTPLRAFGTSSQRGYQAVGRIKKGNATALISDFLQGRSNRWQFGRRYDKSVQDAAVPKRMEGLLWQIGALFRITPTRLMGASVSISVMYLYLFYSWNLVKLPLNGRKAFIIQTDQEALDRSHMMSGVIMELAGAAAPRYDDLGVPLDPRTRRMERIMDRLRAANPELDQHLVAGGRWTPVVVARNQDIDYTIAVAYLCGVILLAGDIMDDLDDDHLSFLLAHEMTHAVQRHENEKFGNNIFFYHFFRNVLKPMKEYIVDFDMKTYISYFAKNLNFVNPKTQEMEADEFGFQFASKACFDYRKFGLGLHEMERLQAEKLSFGQILAYMAMAAKASQEAGTDSSGLPWDDQVFAELEKSDFWLKPEYPSM